MKRIFCMALVAVVCLGTSLAFADKPEPQATGNAIRVSPVKAAVISQDLQLKSSWQNTGGIAQDCWDVLVYDQFEPVHRVTPWSGDMYTPTDGAAWGGWGVPCDIGGTGGGGTSYRWFYGTTYCNPNIVNDMTMLEPPASGRYGMAEVAWWWYVNGVGTSEDLYLVIYCAEDFLDCTAGPPGAANYYDGVIWLFTNLAHGGYYYATLDACSLGGAALPADGEGAYHIIWANARDDTYIYLASCAQPMLWGCKLGPDWDGNMNPSTQHDLQWDDDAPTDGQHVAEECYSYFWDGYCPDTNGAMACFWGLISEGPCDGPNATQCGDADCDGDVDGFDIDPFVIAVGNLNDWLAIYTCDPICSLDANGDENVDGFDIDGFVAVVGGGLCPRDE